MKILKDVTLHRNATKYSQRNHFEIFECLSAVMLKAIKPAIVLVCLNSRQIKF